MELQATAANVSGYDSCHEGAPWRPQRLIQEASAAAQRRQSTGIKIWGQ
jgi:hypothetical protein